MRDDRESRKLNAEALVELLRTEGLDFSNSARSWVLDCPECGKHKWAIRKTDGYSKCYRCDADFKGYADYTLSVVLKRPKPELSQLLYGVVVDTVTPETRGDDRWVDHWGEMDSDDVETIEVVSWPPELLPSPDHHRLDSDIGEPGRRYLEGRGVPLAVALEYGITYDPVQQRVIFPLVVEGVLRGWQGRLVVPGKYIDSKGKERERPKALTEGEIRGNILGFQDRLKGATHGIITEGPMDALKCHLCGGNTFTMGRSVSAQQLDIYARFYRLKRLYVGLDPDAGSDIERISRELHWYGNIELFLLAPPPHREDLGEATFEENLEQFRSAKPLRLGQTFSYQQTERYW